VSTGGTGGVSTGGAGGVSTGGTGGVSTGGTGGVSTGGTGGVSTGGTGGVSTGGTGGGSAPIPSKGCGKTPTLQSKSTINIKSAGLDRKYILWLPDNYDNKHPYRLILAYHWNTGSAQQVVDCHSETIDCATTKSPFFGLWDLANNSTIFVAPDGIDGGWANTNDRDLTLTDDILTQVEDDLCIDTSHVFANGFSYGGLMTAVLACARSEVFRAVAVYAAGLGLGIDQRSPACDGKGLPMPYYASHGTGDWGFDTGQVARDYFAKLNGCTAQTPPRPPSGGHVCTSFEGCSAGHPVRWCGFDGPHTPTPVDRGQTESWNPKEAWTFFSQF
jgi:poly(3-hydroxybutyrate) depolymerase